jgi:hypothetical protein
MGPEARAIFSVCVRGSSRIDLWRESFLSTANLNCWRILFAHSLHVPNVLPALWKVTGQQVNPMGRAEVMAILFHLLPIFHQLAVLIIWIPYDVGRLCRRITTYIQGPIISNGDNPDINISTIFFIVPYPGSTWSYFLSQLDSKNPLRTPKSMPRSEMLAVMRRKVRITFGSHDLSPVSILHFRSVRIRWRTCDKIMKNHTPLFGHQCRSTHIIQATAWKEHGLSRG